jgi:hypothetical protein
MSDKIINVKYTATEDFGGTELKTRSYLVPNDYPGTLEEAIALIREQALVYINEKSGSLVSIE